MFRIFFSLFFIFSLSACSNLGNINSIYRPFTTSTGYGALIDIKQRAILVGEVYEKDVKYSDGRLVKKRVACAEPSPDSISSYLSNVSANLDITDKGTATFNRSLAENAAFVGLRTQSIQLLRDSYYRLCEAYMNGAIEKNDYDIILRRYQKNTIALLAIESLTGTVKVPQSTVLQSNLSSQLAVLLAKEKSLTSQIKTLAADKVEEKKKLAAELTTTKNNYTNIITVLKNTTASSSGTVSQNSTDIASTVSKLTQTVLETDYYGQLCWSVLTKPKGHSEKVIQSCEGFLNLKNESINSIIKQIEALTRQLTHLQKSRLKDKELTNEEVKSKDQQISQLNLQITSLQNELKRTTSFQAILEDNEKDDAM